MVSKRAACYPDNYKFSYLHFQVRTQFFTLLYNFLKPSTFSNLFILENFKSESMCVEIKLYVSKSFNLNFCWLLINSEISKSSLIWLKERTLKDIFSNNSTYQYHVILLSSECNSQTGSERFASLRPANL